MTWHWRTVSSCDLDGLVDDLNPQMKTLENELQVGRPAIMAGYPDAVGAIVDQTSVSHTGDTVETTLKTFDFGRGAIGAKGGFRITAGGTCQGATSTKDIKFKWGGITVFTLNVQAGNSKAWSVVIDVWNISSTQNQTYRAMAWDGLTLETMAIGTIDVDTL